MNTLTMSMAQGLQMSRSGYTQRQWDRTVGWGKVPKEYSNMTKYVEISLFIFCSRFISRINSVVTITKIDIEIIRSIF